MKYSTMKEHVVDRQFLNLLMTVIQCEHTKQASVVKEIVKKLLSKQDSVSIGKCGER